MIDLLLRNDRLDEEDEWFQIGLLHPVNASMGGEMTSVTITDDDPAPGLLVEDSTATPVDGVMTFIAALTEPSGQAITVDYWTEDGTAVAGTDYESTAGTLLLLPGEVLGEIKVPIKARETGVGTRTFHVQLGNANRAWVHRSPGVGLLHASPRFVSVKMGFSRGCALADDGSLWCWDPGAVDSTGVPVLPSNYDAVRINGGPWSRFDSGLAHTCAVGQDHGLWCWGWGGYGMLGTGTLNTALNPVQVEGAGWANVATGMYHTCATKEDGTLWCWGYAGFGALGVDENTIDYWAESAPLQVEGSDWAMVAAGWSHSCGTKGDGTLWCWGNNLSGELGDGTHTSSYIPVQVLGTGWVSVTAESNGTCAIKGDGSRWCWGLVVGEPESATPRMLDDQHWQKQGIGYGHKCGLEPSGALWCWGQGWSGALGNGKTFDQADPQRVPGGPWTDFSHGYHESTGISHGWIWRWGFADYLTVDEGPEDQRQPFRVDDARWLGVSVGTNGICGVQTDHTVWCWGYSQPDMQTMPEQALGTGWTKVEGNSIQTCALRHDDTLWCWLGHGPASADSALHEPTGIPWQIEGTGWVELDVGGAHNCAVQQSGALWCWGSNTTGQLGDGTQVDRIEPVPVTGGPWLSVAVSSPASTGSTCAIHVDHSLWCWGVNHGGQLGQGDLVQRLVPARVTGEGWHRVTSGWNHACATRLDGTLWCWGSNSEGQLGVGDYANHSAPVAVEGNDWIDVSAGRSTTCALKADHSLWCWGQNDRGQLGTGHVENARSPQRVAGSDWSGISVGGATVCAIAMDQSLWCWGSNKFAAMPVANAWRPYPQPIRLASP